MMRELITMKTINRLETLSYVQCGWITGIAWAPDGITLGISGAEGVRLYVGKFGGAATHDLKGHEGRVSSVAFSPLLEDENGNKHLRIVSSSEDSTINIWDASDLSGDVTLVQTIKEHSDSVEHVVFSANPDRRLLLASCSADGSIHLYDGLSGERTALLAGHERQVTSATFALKDNVLITGSKDNTVRLWDTEGETEGTIIGKHDDWVRDVTTNPTGTMVASASKDTTIRLWDPHSGEQYAVIRAHTGGADCVRFSPDGSLMATGGRDHTVRLWDVNAVLRKQDLQPQDALTTLVGHDKPVLSMGFNLPGTLLATGSGDHTVRLWSIAEDNTPQKTETQETPTALFDEKEDEKAAE